MVNFKILGMLFSVIPFRVGVFSLISIYLFADVCKLKFSGEAATNESLPPGGRGTTKWWKERADNEAKFVSP